MEKLASANMALLEQNAALVNENKELSITASIFNSQESMLTAEGVETENQMQILIDASCHRFQGYLFDNPLPASELEESIKKLFNS